MNASHMPLLYTPNFWDPAKADLNYEPDLEGAMLEGRAFAQKNHLEPAEVLIKRGASLAFLTDLQQDFRPRGRLPVQKTDPVILRCCARTINGFITGHFGGLKCSRDGHPPVHISFGTYYRTQDGQLLDLRTRKAAILALADEKMCIFKATGFEADGSPVDLGFVQPLYDPKDAVAYYKHLDTTGQLPMWAFAQHCVLGTDGAALHPLLLETIAFVSGMRSFVPGEVTKGHIINTDWFGPLEPCRPDLSHPQGVFQKGIVDGFKKFRTVEFFGVAEDFCDYWMKAQTMRYLAGTEFMAKLVFVEDGTAPIIPNAKHVSEQNARAKQAGVKFIMSDTPFDQSL